jgi:REP element-mobilizing transposase RayT
MVTFRLADSLPAEVMQKYLCELEAKPDEERKKILFQRLDKYLDTGYGACWLSNKDVAKIVQDAFLNFDGQRYHLLEWVIMPNHVHILVETMPAYPIEELVHSWKSFTANEANKVLCRSGAFWMEDYFDRFIRDENHYADEVRYIRENPLRAGFVNSPGKWFFGSAAMGESVSPFKGTDGKRFLAPKSDEMPGIMVAGRMPAHPEVSKKSFEFLKTRLGLMLCEPGKLDELLLGSPFDYAAQCRFYIPAFMPEPGGGRESDFSEALSGLLAEMLAASEGRALVLYTSYAALAAGAKKLRKLLGPENIEVLAQGEDGSRESLLERLKAGRRTVLLGTSSFWEGVDVRGEALSLLVIAKLPFAVFTDPIVQGRCELLEQAGKDAFLHFSVPNAILRLRQGFGRLIRAKTDRGVVVLADKRVLTKRYGAAFLRALPAEAQTVASQDNLVRAVKEFLQNGTEN